MEKYELIKKASDDFRKKIIKEVEEAGGNITQEEDSYFLILIITHMYKFSPQNIKDDVDWFNLNINKNGFLDFYLNKTILNK